MKEDKRTMAERIRSYLWSCLPKRKTTVRAAICGLLASAPLLLAVTLTLWNEMEPVWLVVASLVYQFGVGEDVRKQLRWMSKMSMRGPIPGFVRFCRRQYVRAKRKYHGDALDVLPLAPTAVGPTARMTKGASLKWLVKPHSDYSMEAYEVQVRPAPSAGAGGGDEPEWTTAAEAVAETKYALGDLEPDTEYAVRVRAHNSKGRSEWCTASFRTKQQPVDQGGTGPGYTWNQSGKKAQDVVLVVPLPAGTRAKQLSVTVKPAALTIALQPASGGAKEALVAGELYAAVKHDDIEWEIGDAAGGGDGKELKLTMQKLAAAHAFWPCVVKGHPEIDMSSLKKEQMSTEELMEELQSMGLSPGMGGPGMNGMSMMNPNGPLPGSRNGMPGGLMPDSFGPLEDEF